MLSLTCLDDHGNKIAECHHVHPRLLWATIVGVFCDIFSQEPDEFFLGPDAKVYKGGLTLGQVEIRSQIAA